MDRKGLRPRGCASVKFNPRLNKQEPIVVETDQGNGVQISPDRLAMLVGVDPEVSVDAGRFDGTGDPGLGFEAV